jgi:hypothetical protein
LRDAALISRDPGVEAAQSNLSPDLYMPRKSWILKLATKEVKKPSNAIALPGPVLP